jgi:glycosyltransferase involved in cell wall biosynthesis
MSKMKIAYLLKSISRESGGLFHSCRRLAQTISRGQDIIVLGVVDEFTKTDIKEWAPLRPIVFRAVGPRDFGYAPRYAEVLAAAAPDLAHVHALWTYPSVAGYLWHRRAKRPFLYSTHGMLDPWALRNSGWKKRLARMLWEDAAHRSAACFHVNSEAEHRTLRHYGIRNPICVIPHGIDLPKLAEGSELSVESLVVRVGQGRKILLYLGRVHPKKNLVALLKAWAIAQKPGLNSQESEEWLLVIAGWDQRGYEGELKRLSRELGLLFLDLRNQTSEIRNGGAVSSQKIAARTAATAGRSSEIRHLTSVIFLGPQFGAENDACYRRCDAFVLPSLSEGLPMAVLEAWAYAKPVMMTPECNLPEGVAAGAAIEIGIEATEIARGLTQLFGMAASDRKEMGARGRALVAEKFSWPRIGEQMGAVYEWVLAGGAPPETVRID